jgi:predicted O-methyltransferase YrrM
LPTLYLEAGPTASGQKVMLATPCYDSPDASYTFAMARSREALSAAGIQSAYYLLQGNCHVDDSRNAIVRDFLASDCTELVFLDADVSWEPDALIELCGYDRDIVGGVYPFRRETPDNNMPVRMLGSIGDVDRDGLLEVEGLPTGFMKIKRAVLERMVMTAKHFVKDEGDPYPVLFERDYYGGGRRGGDIRFCMMWREMGGKIYAAPEIQLGHCGKSVINGTLGSSLRRRNGLSFKWVADRIKDGTARFATFREAYEATGNIWAAQHDVLELATGLARSTELPVLEMGSGISTVCMAATGRQVWAVEHDPRYAIDTERMAHAAGVASNIMLVETELLGGWYDLDADMAKLPAEFGVGLVDGPPRAHGSRMRFFEVFGDRCRVIVCDDVDDVRYREQIRKWAASKGREIKIDGRSAVILPKE